MATSIKISDETKKELFKIGAEFTAEDGVKRSLEEIIKILIDEHRAKKRTIRRENSQ